MTKNTRKLSITFTIKRWLGTALFLIVLISIVLNYQFCSLGNRTPASGPYFKLTFKYSTLPSAQRSQLRRFTFCVSHIKFYPSLDLNNPNPNATTQTLYFNLDDVDYNPNGTDLGFLSLTAGKYQRIDLILANQCSSNRSLQVTNNQGIFSTQDSITLSFIGLPLDINENTTKLTLDVDNIVLSLLTVTSNTGIKLAAQASNGSF